MGNITQTPIFAPTYLNSSMYSNVTGGQVVEARREDGEVQFVSGLKQVSTVAEPNVNYTNGVVHIIDEVLMIPGNLTSTAQNANLTGNLTMDMLADILSYHVIEGTVAYSSDLSNTSLTTLQGDEVEITIAKGSVMVNNATVPNANILFAGRVIHVIDQVLNPNSSSSSNSSSSGSDNAFGATSSASEAPFTSGQPTQTTTYTELVTSTSQVIISQTPTGGAGGAGSGSGNSDSSESMSSSTDGAWIAKPTGAMGAAALFGGAAFLAGM